MIRRSPRSGLLAAVLVVACARDVGVTGGVVAAATPEAAQAGNEILAAGGNAIDAAVAVQFTLAVTEPAMSGLGGQTQILMMGPTQPPLVVNGTSYAPSTLPGRVNREGLTGHRASTVPTTVRVLELAWRHHGSGTVPWGDLLAPAIRYAESGFVVGQFRHLVWRRHRDELAADPETARLFLNRDGTVPAAGQIFRQPVLAETLRRLAAFGAEDFYTGEIAGAIAREMEEGEGWITSADLAGLPIPERISPLRGTYRDVDVYTLPPPGAGWVVLQILNLLEQSDVSALAPQASTRPQRIVEALRIGHRSRRETPVESLRAFQDAVAHRTSKTTARELLDAERESGETTHFTVVDRSGMVVSVTASINAYFGSRSVIPNLGFLLNSYMHEFELDKPQHPFALSPRGMPYSSMSPTIVARDGQPVLGLGSPGSARIISAVAQVLAGWVDGFGTLAENVARPRLHVVPNDRVYVEDERLGTSLADSWSQMELRLVDPSTDLMLGNLNAYYGGVHAVALEGGRWVGAADPRRDGAVHESGREPALARRPAGRKVARRRTKPRVIGVRSARNLPKSMSYGCP
jgi:gamma-glutamyltranspeptidase/glutathione hydrolase